MAGMIEATERRFLRTLHETAARPHISWRGLLVLSAFWFAIAYVMQPLGGNIIPLLVARFTEPTTIHLGSLALPVDVNTYVSLLGTIVGVLVVGALLIPTHHVRLAILTLPLVVAIAGVLVIFGVPDRRRTSASSQPLARSVFLSFAIDTKRYRDFAWLMVSRLFFLMAPVGISTYAFNFIRYTFHYSEGKASLYSSALQAIVVIFAAILCMTAGFLAERYGKKRLIAAACVIGAVGSALLVFAPSLPWILGFGLIVGISLGTFLSVDWAFMTDLIPKAEAGRYMGVSNIATASAGLIARPILGPIIDAFNNNRASAVGYRVVGASIVTEHAHRHLATRGRVHEGVVDQDQQELTHPTQIGVHPDPTVQIRAKLDATRFRHGRRLHDQPLDQLIQLHRPRIEVQLPGIGQGQRGQVADDPVQLFDLIDDALRIRA